MKTKLKLLILSVMISSSLLCIGCDGSSNQSIKEVNKNTKTITLDENSKDLFVNAEVWNKSYIESEDKIIMVPISNGKTTTLISRNQHNDEKFNVTLKYEDVTTTINNKDLYNKVKKGDKIKVRLFKSWTGYRSLMI